MRLIQQESARPSWLWASWKDCRTSFSGWHRSSPQTSAFTFFPASFLLVTHKANMKMKLVTLSVLLSSLAFTACKKSPSSEQSANSAQESSPSSKAQTLGNAPFAGGRTTSFQEVTSQLDPGGSLFLYLATDQWLAGLSTNISAFRQIILSLPGPGMENSAEIEHVFELL